MDDQDTKEVENVLSGKYLNVEPYDAVKAAEEDSFDDRATYNSSASETPAITNNTSNTSTNSSTSSKRSSKKYKRKKRRSKSKKRRRNTSNSRNTNNTKIKNRKYSETLEDTNNNTNNNESPEPYSPPVPSPSKNISKRKKKISPSKQKKKPSSKRAKDAYAALTKQERREFRNAFRLFDKDDDGQITIKELRDVFEGLNYHFTREQLLKMVESIDDNSDGVIDIHEFVLVMSNDTLYSDVDNMRSYLEEVKEAFEVFDKDGDGSISIDELAHIMEALGEKLNIKDIVDMMFEADEDGNGNIDFEEFMNLMEEDHILYRYNQGNAFGADIKIDNRNGSRPCTPVHAVKKY